MAEKMYHQQPCFCIPCRVMKDGKEPKEKLTEKKPKAKKRVAK
jgi:hypothetical protein